MSICQVEKSVRFGLGAAALSIFLFLKRFRGGYGRWLFFFFDNHGRWLFWPFLRGYRSYWNSSFMIWVTRVQRCLFFFSWKGKVNLYAKNQSRRNFPNVDWKGAKMTISLEMSTVRKYLKFNLSHWFNFYFYLIRHWFKLDQRFFMVDNEIWSWK